MEKHGAERIAYQGRIIEVVEQPMLVNGKERTFEFARRPPGTRLIILTPQGLLMTREYRSELEDYDYRLPGGKVFDTLTEYNQFLKSGEDILTKAKEAATKEAHEEVGIRVQSIEQFSTSKAGATVVWDLFYFIVKEYTQHKQQLEEGENISTIEVPFDEVKAMCLDGRIQEDRSVAALLKFLHQREE